METSSYEFHLPTSESSIIKVIGVGGGGSNAVSHMHQQGIKDVSFIICNTDKQALMASPVPNRLQIGAQLTGGLGAGGHPTTGEESAKESKEDITTLLKDNTRMLFITAGMGGGTGTGAAPVIAQMAHDMGILTVGIVTLPFQVEGSKKMKRAEEGIEKMKTYCDTVLVILNEKLREVYGEMTVREAFAKANDVLTIAAKGIAEIITVPGEVNVDFEDVNTVVKGAGDAVMGSSTASGEDRALKAIEAASTSPLLNNQQVYGAKKILLSIVCGDNPEMSMAELNTITEYVQSKIGEDAELIFGHSFDASLSDKIAVTLIATGFCNESPSATFGASNKKVHDLYAPLPPTTTESNGFSSLLQNGSERSYNWEKDEKVESSSFSDSSSNSFEIEENVSVNASSDSEDQPLEELKGEAHALPRRHTLVEEKEERLRLLSGVKNPNNFDTETFKSKQEPAYLRRNVSLPEVPSSVQRNLSRFYLDAEDKLLGKNRFLYDNVD